MEVVLLVSQEEVSVVTVFMVLAQAPLQFLAIAQVEPQLRVSMAA